MTRLDIAIELSKAIKLLHPEYTIYINYPIIDKYINKPLNICINDIAMRILNNNPFAEFNINYKVGEDIDSFNKYVKHIHNKLKTNQYNLNDEWVPSYKSLKMNNIEYYAIADISIAYRNKIIEYWVFDYNDNDYINDKLADNIIIGDHLLVALYTPKFEQIHSYRSRYKHLPEDEYLTTLYSKLKVCSKR